MIQRAKEKIRCVADEVADIAYKDNFAYSELHFATLMFLWGLWVFWPTDTFSAAAGFELMSKSASPFLWGSAAITLGYSRIHCLLHRRRINLAVLSLISGWYWIFVASSFLISDAANTGFIVYVMLGLYQFWVYKSLLRHS